MNQSTQSNLYETEYLPFIHRFGRATNLLGVVFAFFPVLVLTFCFGLHPPVSAVIAGTIMQVSVTGIFCILEPITYAPILGAAGTYMSFLSGNVTNLRVPAAAAAMTAADVEPGTEKGSIVSTVGMAVSILVNILPALFGALLAQQFVNNPKIGTVSIALTGIMFALYKTGCLSFLPGNPVYAVVLTSVFGSILIGKKMAVRDMDKTA